MQARYLSIQLQRKLQITMYWIFFTKDAFLTNIHEVHSFVEVEKQKLEGKTINTSISKLNEYKHRRNHISCSYKS